MGKQMCESKMLHYNCTVLVRKRHSDETKVVSWSSGIKSALEPNDLSSNPAWSTLGNRAVTMNKLLMYSTCCRFHSKVLRREQ